MAHKSRYLDPRLAELVLPPDSKPITTDPTPIAEEREIASCCVAVLVVDNGRVLLIQEKEKSYRDPSGAVIFLWGFPGGGRKPQETLIEAAEREVLEEVGISVEVSAHPIYEQRLPDQEHPGCDHLFVVMLGSNPRGNYKKGSGITKIEWHPITRLPIEQMLPKHRSALLQYIRQTPQLTA